MAPKRRTKGTSRGRLSAVLDDVRARHRTPFRWRTDDLYVRLVVPVGLVVIAFFVLTGQTGESVASLLGAILTAVFAALTFRLLRNQNEASWLTSRPFLWCSVEHSTNALRIVVENRSEAPALNVQLLLDVGYDRIDPSTSLIAGGLGRGSASAIPPTTGRLTATWPEPDDVSTIAVFVVLDTQLGHTCAFHFRLKPSETASAKDRYLLEEMHVSLPARLDGRRRNPTAGDTFAEMIAILELLALPKPAREQLANVREYHLNEFYTDQLPITVEVSDGK